MSDQLHLKPNLDYLKRQARQFQKAYNNGDREARNWVKKLHPKVVHETTPDLPEKLALADAQLVAARGYGFPSWPKLKSYIESINSDFAAKVFAFLNAATPSPNVNHRSGTVEKAAEILDADPTLAQADIYTASVTGDAKTIEKLLQANPALVNEKGGPRNWQPILYLCFSRFLRFQPEKTPQFTEALKTLLAHGADPNVHFMCGQEIETPLYGAAGVANNARIMQILLEAGADVNDPDAHYHVAEFDNRACWRLLFEHGVNEEGKTTMMLRRLDFDDLEGVADLLKLGCDPNARGYWGKTALHQAIMRGKRFAFFELLIEHGADVNANRADGKSAFALACRYGRKDVVALLRKHHASEEMSLADQFIGACSLEGDKQCDEILKNHPEIVKSFSADDKAAIVDAALDGRTKAAKMMLDAGFDVAQKGWLGGTALHAAAWKGFAETVELLLSRGAPVDLRDDTYQNTPLGWGAYGSSACRNPRGDYMRTVQSLVHAGAEIQKYMIDDASEEVAAWLREYVKG